MFRYSTPRREERASRLAPSNFGPRRWGGMPEKTFSLQHEQFVFSACFFMILCFLLCAYQCCVTCWVNFTVREKSYVD